MCDKIRDDSSVTGERRLTSQRKLYSLSRCTMVLTNMCSDWMLFALSGLQLTSSHYVLSYRVQLSLFLHLGYIILQGFHIMVYGSRDDPEKRLLHEKCTNDNLEMSTLD